MTYREKFFAANPGTKLPFKRGTYYQCVGCGQWFSKKDITVDHKISRRMGGTDEVYNLQPMCRSCNSSKRERSTTKDKVTATVGAVITGDIGNLVGSMAKQKVKDIVGIKYKRR